MKLSVTLLLYVLSILFGAIKCQDSRKMMITNYNVINQTMSETLILGRNALIARDLMYNIYYFFQLGDLRPTDPNFSTVQPSRYVKIFRQGNFSGSAYVDSNIYYELYGYDQVTNSVFIFKYNDYTGVHHYLSTHFSAEFGYGSIRLALLLVLVLAIVYLCMKVGQICKKDAKSDSEPKKKIEY